MKNLKEELAEIYSVIKEQALITNSPFKSKSQLARDIKIELRNKFGYSRNDTSSDKRFKKFFIIKYRNIGLQSKETRMLDNMINSAIDSLEYNEVSLSDLSRTVTKMDSLSSKANSLNLDCDNIIKELNKISKELEEQCHEA